MPTVVIEDGRNVVGLISGSISADEWQAIYGSGLPIPMITPEVRVSPTNGYRDGGFYTFIVPTTRLHNYSHSYRSVHIESPDIINGSDGFRYYDYRHSSINRVPSQSGLGWKDIEITEPSGIVLFWRPEDEEHYVLEPTDHAVMGP